MAKHSASRVGLRLDDNAARELVRYCSRNGCTTSAALRAAIGKLGVADADAQLASLLRLLKLPPDSDPSAILDAVNSLLSAGEPPPDQAATAETADPQPATLSKAERDYCARNKLTATQFAAKKAGAVRRAPNRPAPRKAH